MHIEPTKTGALQIQQGGQIQEIGTVLDVGEYALQEFKAGDVLHFKAWAIDIVTVDGETFYYLDATSGAICGKVK